MRLPDSLPIFELLVSVSDEFPQLCVGVRYFSNEKQPISEQLKFDIIELNSATISAPGRVDCFLLLLQGPALSFHSTLLFGLQTAEPSGQCRLPRWTETLFSSH